MSKSKSSKGAAQPAPRYGHWLSPIRSEQLVQQQNSPYDFVRCGDTLLWIQSLARENGRLSVFTLPDEHQPMIELSPAPLNARSTVHEYGGAACLLTPQTLYLSNYSDQRLYALDLTQTPPNAKSITSAGPFRYADAIWDGERQRLICVMEDHSSSAVINRLVSIEPDSGRIDTLAEGADFYAAPRLSPDGKNLCWLSWNHPYMPWDSTQLWLANVEPSGQLSKAELLAGGPDESIVQARWSPQGQLYFISDRNNFWNIYRYQHGNITACYQGPQEFSKAMWVLGLHSYDFYATSPTEEVLIAAYSSNSAWFIGKIDPVTQELCPLLGPYSNIKNIHVMGDELFFIASHTQAHEALYHYHLNSGCLLALVQEKLDTRFEGYLSAPQLHRFAARDRSQISGFYYPPTNKDYPVDHTTAPPLIIKTHGGPTSAASASLDLAIQFWTSRGFALFDLNYRGSCGEGRQHRRALYGQWGIADVDDCVSACDLLVQAGLADPNKLIIRGSSAGAFCTLAALTFRNTFKAGTSYYGISDLKSLAETCHKFESHYVQQLLDENDLSQPIYQQRSPLFHLDQLTCPVLFFQGALDKVVPPAQARSMVKALQDQHIAVAYYEFDNEGHGFRQQSTLIKTLELEWDFYKKVLAL